jgi:hypothetical protein
MPLKAGIISQVLSPLQLGNGLRLNDGSSELRVASHPIFLRFHKNIFYNKHLPFISIRLLPSIPRDLVYLDCYLDPLSYRREAHIAWYKEIEYERTLPYIIKDQPSHYTPRYGVLRTRSTTN